jgi:hypothetical protein
MQSLQRTTCALDLIFAGALALLPAHAYEWMRGIDPELNQLPDDPLFDFRFGMTLAALLLLVALHIFNIVRSQQVGERIMNGVMCSALTILWAWKFRV